MSFKSCLVLLTIKHQELSQFLDEIFKNHAYSKILKTKINIELSEFLFFLNEIFSL